ncbi:MAG TPA: PilZ domain-containing protein [bacterium]|nr:PilZ domain-containing protein [bacterium]
MTSSLEALSKLRENKAIFLLPLGEAAWDKSRVEMALGSVLHAAHPIRQGRLAPVTVNEDIEVGFSVGEEFFTFFSVVLEARRKPIPLVVLQRPSVNELVNVKRRMSDRVDSLVPVSYEIREKGVSSPPRHTLALNLSATGLALNASEPISPGTFLVMEIHLPNATAGVSASGAIVSCAKIIHPREERYKIRVRFESILSNSRKRIEEFVKAKKEVQGLWE